MHSDIRESIHWLKKRTTSRPHYQEGGTKNRFTANYIKSSWQSQVRLTKLQKRTFLQHSCRDTNRQNMVKPPETTNWNHHPERTHKSTQSPEPVHREHAYYLRPPLALWRNTDSRWSLRLKPTSHSQTITLSLFHRKLLYPRGFSFLLPSPLFPVFFQQQPLFHSWELWPFKEKGSVCLFGLLWRVCLCVCVLLLTDHHSN